MPTNFPGSLDTTTQLPVARSDNTVSATNHAVDHDNVNAAVVAVETKVGFGAGNPVNSYVLTGGAAGASSWAAPAAAPVLNVKLYGAIGNGSTDDTGAINAAIAAASAGDTILFPNPSVGYKITSRITINKALTLVGDHPTITQATSNTGGFLISASNVTIRGLRIVGPQFAVSQSSGIAINSVGTVGAYYTDLTIENCDIQNWGFVGIWTEYTRRFKWHANTIRDCWYAGVIGLCAEDGRVTHNLVQNIPADGVDGTNAYGMVFERHDTLSLAASPRSARILISQNVIRDVPTWEGLDTHGGDSITFFDNAIYNTANGIIVMSSVDENVHNTIEPRNCQIVGNKMVSALTDAHRVNPTYNSCGIMCVGAPFSVTYGSGHIISNNTINGYGTANDSNSGALRLYLTKGLVVSGNTIIDAGTVGINFTYDNQDFSCTGNTILDAWTSTSGADGDGVGIWCGSDTNSGYIGSNTIGKNGRVVAGTCLALNTSPIRVYSANTVKVGPNNVSWTTASVLWSAISAAVGDRPEPRLAGTAAPTIGTWKQGDIVWRDDPASAGFIGWVCTVAGSPGTWKTFGLIS